MQVIILIEVVDVTIVATKVCGTTKMVGIGGGRDVRTGRGEDRDADTNLKTCACEEVEGCKNNVNECYP